MRELDSYDNLLKGDKKNSQSQRQKLKKTGLRPVDLKGIPLDLLMHDDPKMRMQGIALLLKSYHPKTVRILSRLQKLELDPTVRETIFDALSSRSFEQTENSADEIFTEEKTDQTKEQELDSFFAVSEPDNLDVDSGSWQEKVLAVEDSIRRHTEETTKTETSQELLNSEISRKKPRLVVNILYRGFFLSFFLLNGAIAFFFFEAGFLTPALIFVLVALVGGYGAGGGYCVSAPIVKETSP